VVCGGRKGIKREDACSDVGSQRAPTTMQEEYWTVLGRVQGSIWAGTDVAELKKYKIWPGKKVKRFGDNIRLPRGERGDRMVDVSKFLSVKCVISATTNIGTEEIDTLLKDTSLFDKKILPSLVYFNANKVCLLSSLLLSLDCDSDCLKLHGMPSLNPRTLSLLKKVYCLACQV